MVLQGYAKLTCSIFRLALSFNREPLSKRVKPTGVGRRMKERHLEAYLLNVGGLVDGGNSDFAVMRDDASPKFDRKSPSSRSNKTNGVERKTARRHKVFKSDDWYEKAALSFAISAKQ